MPQFQYSNSSIISHVHFKKNPKNPHNFLKFFFFFIYTFWHSLQKQTFWSKFNRTGTEKGSKYMAWYIGKNITSKKEKFFGLKKLWKCVYMIFRSVLPITRKSSIAIDNSFDPGAPGKTHKTCICTERLTCKAWKRSNMDTGGFGGRGCDNASWYTPSSSLSSVVCFKQGTWEPLLVTVVASL